MLIQTSLCPQPHIIVDFPLRMNETLRYDVDLYYSNGTTDDDTVKELRVRVHGYHVDWKTWKNGEDFSNRGILNRLEKSMKFTYKTGKVRIFKPVFIFIFSFMFSLTF